MKSIELIDLTLDEIRRAARKIADAEYQILLNVSTSEKGEDNQQNLELYKDEANLLSLSLERCRIALRNILKDISECQDAHDLMDGVDEALRNVACDLIYEHTTDKDYI